MIFSTSNRETEISKANDDSYFRKSDVVEWLKSNDCFGWLAEVKTKAVIEDLENLPTYSPKNNDNSAETNYNSADLISRKAVLEMLNKIDKAVDDGEGYKYKEWVDYVEELPTIPQPKTDGDLISRKAVLECIGMTSVHSELARKLRQLPTIPQTICDNDCEHCSWVECPLPQTAIKHFGAIECPKCGQLIYNDETEYEWCKGCKEYDTEKHCCHRWSSFIRYTLQDSIDSVLEDIKAEINQERNFNNSNFNIENLSGLVRALEIIDKHISRKE